MNPDDILRMTREVDRWVTNQTSDIYEWKVLRDERFAALVAAAIEAARVLYEAMSETERSRLRTEFPEQMGWVEGLTINL